MNWGFNFFFLLGGERRGFICCIMCHSFLAVDLYEHPNKPCFFSFFTYKVLIVGAEL